MIKISKREDCCGCGACEQICPKRCLSLVSDSEGFLYPHVDDNNCVDCHLCEKACPVVNQDPERVPVEVMAAYNYDEYKRSISSSGGIFSLVAENVIGQGGVVFGVKFDDEWNAVFDYTRDLEGLKQFRGSKYVQAKTGDAYSKVLSFLKEGTSVLFTGTPCQIAGLRHYIGKDYDELLLLDVICEGVPSPKVWQRYLHEELKRQCKKELHIPVEDVVISSVEFRNKERGWKQFGVVIGIENKLTGEKQRIELYRSSAYLIALFNYLTLRPICYECPFKSCKSQSDITIADYWGIHLLHPEMDDDKGTSMVYLNTSKGQSFFIKDKAIWKKTCYEEAFPYNNVISSVKKHHNRDKFYDGVDKKKSVISWLDYCCCSPYEKTRDMLKNVFWNCRAHITHLLKH